MAGSKPHHPSYKHDPASGVQWDKDRWTKKQLPNDICAVLVAAVTTSMAASAAFHFTTKSNIWIIPFFISIIPNIALLGLAATLNARGQRWTEYNRRKVERGLVHGMVLYVIGFATMMGFYGWFAAAYFSSAIFVVLINSLWLIPISIVCGIVAVQLMCGLRNLGPFLPWLTIALVMGCVFTGKKYALDDIKSVIVNMKRTMANPMAWRDTMDIGIGAPP